MERAKDSNGAADAQLDVTRETLTPPLAVQLQGIARETGKSPLQLTGQYMRLAFGPGKIGFTDFVKLRLFDEAFHAGSPLDAYVGSRRNRDICVEVNHRHDWFGLMGNKVASGTYLAAHGLPTIPTAALFAPRLCSDAPGLLRDRAALEAFLLSAGRYPLFGKPVEGIQSLGSIGLARCLPQSRMLEKIDGTAIALDDIVTEIATHYAAGYLFQPLMAPHSAIKTLCGSRLACLRVVTALTEAGPQVLRTAWKLPVARNAADNYWRPGNLLAEIDIDRGEVRRVTSGTGLATRLHERHPDSGVDLIGFEHPHWAGLLAVALEGARVMQHVPLIGWDIAATDDGPVIVEMNESPDLFLVQFADRRGIRDAAFEAFLAFQKRCATAYNQKARARIARL
jgi:hypothetical protein